MLNLSVFSFAKRNNEGRQRNENERDKGEQLLKKRDGENLKLEGTQDPNLHFYQRILWYFQVT